MPDGRCPAGADPAIAAVVFPVLVLETRLKIIQQFLGRQPLQFLFVNAQGIRHFPGVLQPFLQQALGYIVKFQAFQIGQLGPGEGMGEHLVESIEIALAFNQYGPASRVKIGQRSDQPGLECAVQR